MTADECMKKYPRLTAHMICASLGYFPPQRAGNAISHYKAGEPFFCEWYSHMGQFRNDRQDLFDKESVLSVGRDVIRESFALRHTHAGYMKEYQRAKALVDEYNISKREPELASWF